MPRKQKEYSHYRIEQKFTEDNRLRFQRLFAAHW